MFASFTQSAIILFREGLEAALMLSALAAYLVKANAGDRIGFLYFGAALGGVVSIVLGFALHSIIEDMPAHSFESALTLSGAIVMFYVSGWIWARREPGVWSRFVKARADEALAQAGTTIAAVAFLVVLREGAEIVLFINAVARGNDGWNAGITGGIAAGVILLILVFAAVRILSIRLPLRLVFSLTSACLFLMGLKFIGESLAELQAGNLIPGTPVVGGGWLHTIGFNPTWEAVIVQIMLIALAMTGFIALMRRTEAGKQDLA